MHTRWGENFAGRTSQDVFTGSYREYLESVFALSISKRLPVFTASRFRWDNGFLWTRRVMLPFMKDRPNEAAQILVVQTWPRSGDERATGSMVIVPGTASDEN